MNTDILSYGTNQASGGIGVGAYQRARAAGLSATQISQLAGQQGVYFGQPLEPLIVQDVISELSLGFNQQFGQLDEQFRNQASQFQGQQNSYQNQIANQQAQFQQSQAQFANLQNAQVPVAEKTAQERRAEGSTATPKRQSGLSSLALVSGLGTNANPLSGLQLA
jgi:hypothetical protein